MKTLTSVFCLLMIGTMVIHAQMQNEVVLPNGRVLPKPPVPPKGLVHPSRVAPEKRAAAEAGWREWQEQLAAYKQAVKNSSAIPCSQEDLRYLAEVEKAKDQYGGVVVEKLPQADQERFDRHIFDSHEHMHQMGEDAEIVAIVGKRPASEVVKITLVASDVHFHMVFDRFPLKAAIAEVQKQLSGFQVSESEAEALLTLMAQRQSDLESKIVRFDRNGKIINSVTGHQPSKTDN